MQVKAIHRFARISPFKAREVTREIQGHSASDALDLLAFSPKKAAVLVKKTLKSAIANAENNANLKVDTLLVREAVVGEGPTLKRFRARARGGASPLLKRTSHIRIILSDDFQPKTGTKRSKKASGSEEKPKAKRETIRKRRTPSAKRPAEPKAPAVGKQSSNPAQATAEQPAAETEGAPVVGRHSSAPETQRTPEEKE
jgi:large subunit ribosomal protein L22